MKISQYTVSHDCNDNGIAWYFWGTVLQYCHRIIAVFHTIYSELSRTVGRVS